MNRRDEMYRIERELADRLREAPKERRPRVAREVYAELYQRVPWHQDLTSSLESRQRNAEALAYTYERWVGAAAVVLEIGAGSCDVLRRLGPRYPESRFVGMDVAREPLQAAGGALPRNVCFVQAGAAAMPLATGTVSFVFCSQVLEHFHPDDVADYLAEVGRVLKPGGWLGLDTPNRITGPHDISRGFTPEATGLHLKEWTHRELRALLLDNGFDRVWTRVLPGRLARLLRLRPPGPLIDACQKANLETLVARVRHAGLRSWLGRMFGLTGIFLYARRRVAPGG